MASHREGLIQDEKTGEWYLPATQRADGSWRKPRKVKEGYIPQEEVPTYENKGVQWLKSQPTGPIGLAPSKAKPGRETKTESDISEPSVPLSKSAKKNLKRREKKKQQNPGEGDEPSHPSSVQSVANSLAATSIGDCNTGSVTRDSAQSNSHQAQAAGETSEQKLAVQKKLRNLFKKLKAIDELQAKIDSGEVKTPEPQQLEKIARRGEIVEQIEDLEMHFDD